MAKIIDIDFRTGSLREKVNDVLPAISGSGGLKTYNRGSVYNIKNNTVVLNYGNILDYGTEDFTIVLNVYIGLEITNGSLFGSGYYPGLSCYYSYTVSQLRFYLNSGGATHTIPNINKGREYCIVYKRISDSFYYSVNGANFVFLNTVVKDLTSPSDFVIGKTVGFSAGIGINIYNLKIENIAYTQTQANQEYKEYLNRQAIGPAKRNFAYEKLKPTDLSNEEGLVAAYNMKPNNGVLVDISGNGNNGTINGHPLSTKEGMSFDGTNDFTRYNNNTIIGNSAFTLMGRYSARTLTKYSGAIFIGQSATNLSAYLGTVAGPSGGGIGNSIGGGFYGFNIGTGVITDAVVNVALTYDGGNLGKIKLYVNGVLYNDISYTRNPNISSNFTQLGKIGTDSIYNLDGILENAKIYNYALSLQEIKDYHNQYAKQVSFIDDFKYEPADGNNITPKGWIKGTGDYKISELTADDNVLTHLKKGAKMLECTTAGTIAFQSKQAYGTWEFDILNMTSSAFIVYFISNEIDRNITYSIYHDNKGHLQLNKNLSEILRADDVPYQTYYSIKCTRTVSGVFTVYIKGGAFGNTYQLLTADVGTNPITDNTYTESNFTVLEFDIGDKISNIKYSKGIEEIYIPEPLIPLVENILLTDLAGYWKFEEASLQQVMDSVGSLHSVANTTTSTTGKICNGFSFNGLQQYVSFGNVLNYDSDDSFSFACWINRDDRNTNTQTIMSKMESSGAYAGSLFMIRGGVVAPQNILQLSLRHSNYTSDILTVYGQTEIISGWVHVAFTYDGSSKADGVKIYVNGTDDTGEQYQDALTGSIQSTAALSLGSRNNSGLFYVGDMDEVAFWDRELTADDITDLYNEGSGFQYDFTTQVINCP